MSKQDHRERDESLSLILAAIAENPTGLTRTQIARALNRTKTPHLIDLIEGLVADGYLIRRVRLFGNGVEGYVYLAPDNV
ncbi:MAG: hypothetical protein WBC91_09390 [Phototrophicaceae bacterium]